MCMSYQLIDHIILQWTRSHSFHVSTIYKDEEIRSIDVINIKGERFQIWFDPPVGNHIGIHVWNYKNKKDRFKKDWLVKISDLESTLIEVLKTVNI